jgi:hypothetical protein
VATSAPGAELAAGLKTAGTGPATLTSGAMLLVVAWSDAYRVPLDVLTPAGRKAVDRVRSSCLQELARAPAAPAVRPGDLLTTPPWPALLARNTPGHAATTAPVFIAPGRRRRAGHPGRHPRPGRAAVPPGRHRGAAQLPARRSLRPGRGRQQRRGGVDRRAPGRPARPIELPTLSAAKVVARAQTRRTGAKRRLPLFGDEL